MIIYDVPLKFRPNYTSVYPPYSYGNNMEEICYNYFLNNKDNIFSDYVYLPVFWSSYYVINNYAENIDELYNWLDTLDKSKKYFTIVQYASGIFVKNFNLNLLVFSAGGGGLNVKNDSVIREVTFNGLNRHIFFGNKADYDIPLLCLPEFPFKNVNKDIFCSFMGRFDTHKCRIDMKLLLDNNKNFMFFDSIGFKEYNDIINRSMFTLAPRGYGYTSFRLYEAIAGNSIPIYIWEDKKVLPYNDIIDWNDIAIVINSSEINNLPNILKNTNIPEKLSNISKLKHMFTFEYIFKYISKKIETPRTISVAIPHYNNSYYIKDAIDPLINDDRINEIIICDDKSVDINNLKKIIADYNNKKLKLYENNVNLGCYHNKINSISKCSNEWAILLDSDNIYSKNCIDTLYSIDKWNKDTIYAPSWAITFPGQQPSPMLNYTKFDNQYITKKQYISFFNDNIFQCLINTCNYFLPVKEFTNLMQEKQNLYLREIIDSLDSAVLFTDWLCDNNKIYVVKNLHYKHRLHEKSNYMMSSSHKYSSMVLTNLLDKVKIK